MIVRIFVVFLIFALLGCDKAKENVLITVDDQLFTEEQLAREIDLSMALFQHRTKRDVDSDKMNQFRKMRKSAILQSKLSEMLLWGAVRRSKIRVSPSLKQHAETKYVQRYGRKGEDFKALLAALPSNTIRDSLEARIAMEVQTAAFLDYNYSNRLAVTERLVDDTIAAMHRGDENANRTNAVIYGVATNVWRLAKSGADFTQLVRQYSQDENLNDSGDMGDNCDFSDFQDEEALVWNTISKLKAGDVTPPLDTSDGLSIYKCLDRHDSDSAQGGVFYHLARIVFYRALLFQNYDRNYVYQSLRSDLRGKVIKEIVKHEANRAHISIVDANHKLPKGFERQIKALKEL